MSYSVFVSYSTKDLETVNALSSWVRHAGAEAYVAEYSAQPGQVLAESIIGAIKRSDLFLLLWSSNANGSEWVPQEIGVAKGLGKPIMPVVLHRPLQLPGFIKDLKFLPLYEDPQAGAEWLYSHVLKEQSRKNASAIVTVGVVGAILLALSTGKK